MKVKMINLEASTDQKNMASRGHTLSNFCTPRDLRVSLWSGTLCSCTLAIWGLFLLAIVMRDSLSIHMREGEEPADGQGRGGAANTNSSWICGSYPQLVHTSRVTDKALHAAETCSHSANSPAQSSAVSSQLTAQSVKVAQGFNLSVSLLFDLHHRKCCWLKGGKK